METLTQTKLALAAEVAANSHRHGTKSKRESPQRANVVLAEVHEAP